MLNILVPPLMPSRDFRRANEAENNNYHLQFLIMGQDRFCSGLASHFQFNSVAWTFKFATFKHFWQLLDLGTSFSDVNEVFWGIF